MAASFNFVADAIAPAAANVGADKDGDNGNGRPSRAMPGGPGSTWSTSLRTGNRTRLAAAPISEFGPSRTYGNVRLLTDVRSIADIEHP